MENNVLGPLNDDKVLAIMIVALGDSSRTLVR